MKEDQAHEVLMELMKLTLSVLGEMYESSVIKSCKGRKEDV